MVKSVSVTLNKVPLCGRMWERDKEGDIFLCVVSMFCYFRRVLRPQRWIKPINVVATSKLSGELQESWPQHSFLPDWKLLQVVYVSLSPHKEEKSFLGHYSLWQSMSCQLLLIYFITFLQKSLRWNTYLMDDDYFFVYLASLYLECALLFFSVQFITYSYFY